MPVNTTIKIRKGTESEWQSSNPILASGEPGYVTNTNRFKIGDGSTNWNSLSYAAVVPSGFLAGSGINIVLGSQGISATIGVSGLSTSYLSDFNNAVSGLIPVKNIVSGVGIDVSSSNGIFTITSTGSGVLAEQSSSLVTTVFNKTASTIPKMKAVYINGGQGDIPTVQLAIATGDPTSAGTYGLTRESIASMSTGKVTVFGSLTGLDTDQFNPTAPVGNVNGTVLYLSPTVSGDLTTTKPYAPDHIVAIGTIIRTHQNEGIIEVRVQNGFELDELHNVAISGVTNGQFLQYNSASQLWVPSSSGNFTSLSLNGTTVSVVGHTHTSSDITNFNNSVSGLLPTISNSGNNKLLTSTGSTVGINAESNLTFDGDLLNITGSGSFSSNLRINNQTSNTIAGFDASKNISSLSTSTYPNLTELSYVKDVTSSIQTQLNNKAALVHTHVVNDITDFASGVANEVDTTLVATTGIDLNYNIGTNTLTVGVTGLISNPTDNRLLTSRDSSGSLIDAESNLTFDGNLLSITGSGIFTSNLTIDNQTSNTIASFDNNKNLTSLSTSTYPSLTELSYVKGVTSSLQTQLNGKASTSHTHTSSDITNFNSSVSGLLPTVANSGDNRVLTSTGSTVGITAESNLTFDGNLLNVTGSGAFSSNLTLNNQTANTVAGFDASKNVTSLSTATYPSLTELSYVKGVTSAIQTQLNAKQATLTNPVTGTGASNYIAYWNSSSGIAHDANQLYWDSTNDRLGIGTITPSGKIQVIGTGMISSVTGISPNALCHLYSATSGATILNVEGTNGSLFSVVDSLSGTLMSVNNNAGLPVFAVYSDNSIIGGRYNQNDWVVTSGGNIGIGTSSPPAKFGVVGNGNFTGTVTASGIVTGSELTSSQSSGDEGGQINLTKPATNTSINTSVAIDLYQNRLRIFETAGSNRGYYLDITEGATGVGTALRSKTLAYFTPLNNQPPATNFATLDTRNSIAVLDFDDTTEESAVFVGVLPDNAVLASGILVKVHWMATSATTGSCRWGAQFEKMTTDLDSDSFDTATEAHSTTNATAGIVTATSITCTTIDSLAAGDLFRIKIYRDVSDTTNDTMTGDAEIVAVELRSVL